MIKTAELITAKDLSELLNISIRTIWRMDATAELPRSIRLGRSVRWNRKDVLLWIEIGCPNRSTFEQCKNERSPK